MEAISPELALIDPELARAHLEWLEISSGLGPAAGTVAAARPLAPALVEPRWLPAAKVLAALSLAANGFLVSVIVARDDARPAAAPAAEVAVPAPPAVPDGSFGVTTPVRGSAAIEQRLLALVVQSESRRLPRTLLDPVTGLPKDNLQAVCRDGRSGSELCVVRPAVHRAGEGLTVRYTPSSDGTGTFVWSPYRSG